MYRGIVGALLIFAVSRWRGDTLRTISTRYDVSADDLRRWNRLASNEVKPGQRLRITSDKAPQATIARRGNGKPALSTANGSRPAATVRPAVAHGTATGGARGKVKVERTSTKVASAAAPAASTAHHSHKIRKD